MGPVLSTGMLAGSVSWNVGYGGRSDGCAGSERTIATASAGAGVRVGSGSAVSITCDSSGAMEIVTSSVGDGARVGIDSAVSVTCASSGVAAGVASDETVSIGAGVEMVSGPVSSLSLASTVRAGRGTFDDTAVAFRTGDATLPLEARGFVVLEIAVIVSSAEGAATVGARMRPGYGLVVELL